MARQFKLSPGLSKLPHPIFISLCHSPKCLIPSNWFMSSLRESYHIVLGYGLGSSPASKVAYFYFYLLYSIYDIHYILISRAIIWKLFSLNCYFNVLFVLILRTSFSSMDSNIFRITFLSNLFTVQVAFSDKFHAFNWY